MITTTTNRYSIGIYAGLLSLLLTCAPAIAQSGASVCGSLGGPGQYGPYDYRTDKDKLGIVERFHFTAEVEALVRGTQNTLAGGDIDYTLRAFPNHHRALLAMVRYGVKMKSPHPSGADFPVECYFERAIRFRPDDITVRMLYATYLGNNARRPEAIAQLETATTAAADSAFTHYNIGLIYFDIKEFDKALRQAHRALAMGFPRTELRAQLQAAGKWVEP